jgi:hypothetical protein
MAYCASEVVPNLKHKKPPLPNVWLVNLGTKIIQCEIDALGRVGFVFIHGTPHVTPTIEFNELCILLGTTPIVKNGHKICVRKCLPTNISRMKDVATLDAKVVNITFTPQGHTYIYELLVQQSTINNLPCTYFVTIGVFPSCTCLDFVSNATSSRHSYFLSYKHMYYIYNVHLNFVVNTCTHQPSLSSNNVEDILKQEHFEPFCATSLHI